MNSNDTTNKANETLQEILALLEIPKSLYEKAVSRYKSMSEWFHRDESTIRQFDPDVHSQGSFRLGTVIRPLLSSEEYDLDLVCRLSLRKSDVTQKDVKDAVGAEVKSYSKAQSFKRAPEERKRCWTQEYQDEAKFHMDVLPSVAEDNQRLRRLAGAMVPDDQAREAIAITDNTLPNYDSIDPNWPSSNPRGYARWFEERMDAGGLAHEGRRRLVETHVFASVEEVPAYRLKTPLQLCVQLLKRHRDVMFKDDPDGKPISIIVTTLAAMAYAGESDLASALTNILDSMEGLVRDAKPRVPNPVDPEEDFADRWDEERERNFRSWVRQARNDFALLLAPRSADMIQDLAKSKLAVSLPSGVLGSLVPAATVAAHDKHITVSTGPKSWSCRG